MALRDNQKAGRIRVLAFGKSYSAEWKVEGQFVVVVSPLGEGRAVLGGLAAAPATAASEKLMEMAKAASKPARASTGDRSRFDVTDAFRRR